MSPRASSFHFGRKLLLVLIASAVIGLVWAMVETRRTPEDLMSLFRPAPPERTEEASSVTPPKRPEAPDPKPIVKEPPRKAANPAESPKPYTNAAMKAVFADVEDKLRAGRIKEARDRLAACNKQLISPDLAAPFRELERKVEGYHMLLLETNPGALVPTPELAELVTAAGTRALIVRNVAQAGSDTVFETLDGIRSRLPTSDVRELTRITDPGRQRAALDYELEHQCARNGIRVMKNSMAWTFEARNGAAGLAFFDLADFCARNGHATRLTALLDEAIKHDPGILQTVHEAKAERMVNVFLYFVSLRAKEDAKAAYNILKARYRDTRTYREKVEGDGDVTEAYRVLVGERVAKVLPSSDPQKDPVTTETADPEPSPVEEGAPEPFDTSGTELPEGGPEPAARLVRDGDAHFDVAMKHLRNSDPNRNPTGWASENKKALEALTKAFEAYLAAQSEFERARREIPSSLLKRFRDTQMSRSLCRKRAVSTR
ncbi:MAG: hypothetical protein HYY16_17275 [Planctomycetes bacterium]|nr:hypothetical protein [Planctomycetota bacterium]